MSLTRIACATALAGALSLASACGGSNAPDQGALGSTVDPSPTTAAPATPTATASATRTRKPPATTPAASPTSGDGDSVGDNEPFTAGGGVCGRLTASQVGTVVGAGVRGAGLPGGGCEFDHADAHLPAATVKDVAYAGMDAAKSDATSAVEGDPEDLSGIGAGAFVVTGTIFGGAEIQGAGAVHVGSRTLSVFLVQHKALSASAVRDLVVRMLRLVAGAAR